MKLVITNDFALMLAMMENKPFISVDIREGKTDAEGTFITASTFPSGQIYMAQTDASSNSDTNIKFLLESVLTTSEDSSIYNVILDMHTLSSETHKRISNVLSSEFTGMNMTVFMTENEEDRTNSTYIDEYAEKIYDSFIEGLNSGATLINLPDIDFFEEKKRLILDERFVPRFVPGFLSCFLILGAEDFSSQLYKMIKKEGTKVFFEYDRSFKDYLDASGDNAIGGN